MTDLSKFSTCELLKAYDEIKAHLAGINKGWEDSSPLDKESFEKKLAGGNTVKHETKKQEEYDPDATVEHGDHEEDKTKKQDDEYLDEKDKDKEEMKQDEMMTPDSTADVLARILEAINDLKSMLAQEKPVETEVPPELPPQEEMKEAPAPNTQDITVSISKEINKQLKELGISKSEPTPKPKIEKQDDPIKKGEGGLTMDKIKKMSFSELNDYNEEMNLKKGW